MSEAKYYYECHKCGKVFILYDGDSERCSYCHSDDVGPVDEPEIKS
jgi:rRNA maturation endonuclease Nob1